MHLFHENDRSRELYIIQEGSVKVYRNVGGKEIELAIVTRGAVLGEMSLIDGKPRSASARTLEESTVIIIDAETFHDKIRGVPSWFMSIVKMTSNKIRVANKRLQSITSEHQGANIIITIFYLNSRFNESNTGLDIKKTQIQLIQLLGVTYQKVMRIIDFLHKNKFLLLNENTMMIDDMSRMKEYCDFLRFMIRKNYERMIPRTDDIYKIISTVIGEYPEIAAREDISTNISGTIFWNFMEQNFLTEEYMEILELLEAMNLFTQIKREYSEKGSNPIAGRQFGINNFNWRKMYLYSKYSEWTPSV